MRRRPLPTLPRIVAARLAGLALLADDKRFLAERIRRIDGDPAEVAAEYARRWREAEARVQDGFAGNVARRAANAWLAAATAKAISPYTLDVARGWSAEDCLGWISGLAPHPALAAARDCLPCHGVRATPDAAGPAEAQASPPPQEPQAPGAEQRRESPAGALARKLKAAGG